MILTALNSFMGIKNSLDNYDQEQKISEIKRHIINRENLLSNDIKKLIDDQMGTNSSNDINDKVQELINLKGDLLILIENNKRIEQADLIVESINDAIDPFVASILATLKNYGLTLSTVLSSQFKIADIVTDLTTEQEEKWNSFTNSVIAVLENVEYKIDDLEKLISLNQEFQAELAFQMLALKSETNARFTDFQNYVKIKEDELKIQLRILGSLQDNATVVLTEEGELVYSNNVTYKNSTPVVAGVLGFAPVSGYQGIRVTGFNIRQADLVGDGNSFSTNEDTFINLNTDYNGEAIYVAIRTQANTILELLNISTITTIRNLTQTNIQIVKGQDGVVTQRNVTTTVKPEESHLNFHFGLSDGIGVLPQLVDVEILKGSPGLSILKLSVNPGVRGNFSAYATKVKQEEHRTASFGSTQASTFEGLLNGTYSSAGPMFERAIGSYRNKTTLPDFTTAMYKARIILKIPKSNLGIDGVTIFKI